MGSPETQQLLTMLLSFFSKMPSVVLILINIQNNGLTEFCVLHMSVGILCVLTELFYQKTLYLEIINASNWIRALQWLEK
jgi:hypothetical protein